MCEREREGRRSGAFLINTSVSSSPPPQPSPISTTPFEMASPREERGASALAEGASLRLQGSL